MLDSVGDVGEARILLLNHFCYDQDTFRFEFVLYFSEEDVGGRFYFVYLV